MGSNWKIGDKISITTGDSSIDFKIVKRLGQDQGVMGEIWLIENSELKVKFVVKNPLVDFSQNLHHKTSIPSEAKILVTLDFHPNIITCIRIDIIDKIPRYIMEYANFGSLRDLMNERSLNLKDILHFAIQICLGMFHAHNHPHSLIHRDLKPENILLSTIDKKNYDNSQNTLIAKIADFGLVKQLLRTSTLVNDNSSSLFLLVHRHMHLLNNIDILKKFTRILTFFLLELFCLR